jgi:hypothetical protein
MAHHWRFFRAGGFDQVKLEKGIDLVSIGELDQKLWVALACPVKGLEFDQRTLELVDTDKDGRVRASELIAAVRWAGSLLNDVEVLADGSSSLPLAAIRVSHPEGKLLLDTARALLRSLKKPQAEAIDVEDTVSALEAFAREPFNGDGIVPVEGAPDDCTRKLIRDVLAATPSPPIDRAGRPGIDRPTLDAFWAAIDAHTAWLSAGEGPVVRPLGPQTGPAHDALLAIRHKVDDYFTRCKLASFDSHSLEILYREQQVFLATASRDLDLTAQELRALPLARVGVHSFEQGLPLIEGLNPAWAQAIATFRARVVLPLLGEQDHLSEAQWDDLLRKFAPFAAWLQDRQGSAVENLGAARVRELHAGDGRQRIYELVARDEGEAPLARSLESVERLVRYNRDLLKLANNFVSFRDFYARSWATFQAGTLYLDQRACDLCIQVDDPAKHATMAPLAKAYLVYCDLRNARGETRSIVAAMTNGDVDNLMVGRNGVFYDRRGRDWDATVTKIIDNPISVRQAFWSPYKKLLQILEEQIAKRVALASAAADARLLGAAGVAPPPAAPAKATVPPAAPAAPPPPPTAAPAPPQARPFDVGTIAALGVAVGGVTAALGAILQAFFGLGIWMPLGVVGVILLVSGPSMAVAWLKLRQRNLGPLLDANGWAVNAQAKLNVPLGASLTQVAALPRDSTRDLTDPFAERPKPWGFYVAVALILALMCGWWIGRLDPYLPGPLKSTEVLGELAPAAGGQMIPIQVPVVPGLLPPPKAP